MVMVEEEVLKKVLVPATMLEEATIQGRPLLPGGIPHLKHGTVAYAYCIFDTNDRFDLFEQHVWHGQVGTHCELLCRAEAEADEFIAPDACIEITIGCDYSTFRLIRNNGDMETPLDFPIPR